MTLRCSDTFLRAVSRLRLGVGRGIGSPKYIAQHDGRVRVQARCATPLRWASDSKNGVPRRLPPLLDSDERSNTPTKTKLPIARSEATVAALEDELLHNISNKQGTTTLNAILHELIDVRKVKATQLHYTAFFLCQQGSENGSSGQIGNLLRQMDYDAVQMTEGLASAALQALVVHPDLAILLEVLQRCEEKWIKPTRKMQHFVTAIYARLGQFELAIHWLEKLESIQSQESNVSNRNEAELWLYVVLLGEIIQHTSSEELFMTICYRLHDSHTVPMRELDIPFALWDLAFSWAVRNQNFYAVKWIWRTFIVRQYVKPDVELLSQVEQLARKHGDQDLEHSCKAMAEFINANAHRPKDADNVVPVEENRLTASQNHPTMRYARVPSEQRLDPWALLTEDMDPGAAQPRIEQSLSHQAKKDAADRANYETIKAGAPRTTFGGLIFQDVDLKELYAPFDGFKKSSKDPVEFANELVAILRHRDRNGEEKKLTRDLLKVLFNPDSSDSSGDGTALARNMKVDRTTNTDSVPWHGSRHSAGNPSNDSAGQIRSGLNTRPTRSEPRGWTRNCAVGDDSSKNKA